MENYGTFKVRGRIFRAHRMAIYLASGVDPGQKVVCHRCDNPPCCNPAHLFIGTNIDNIKDMIHKGRTLKGEANPATSLTGRQVTEIRQMYKTTRTSHRKIAAIFGVSHGTVGRIIRGDFWTHI
jgi:hypothetical protein